MYQETKFYDILEFSEENREGLKEYICPLCTGVFKDPHCDGDGHFFCKECITRYINDNHSCPLSNVSLRLTDLSRIPLICNIVDKQKIYCKNNLKGCTWIDKVLMLQDHMKNDCLKQDIKCDYEECDSIVTREQLLEHRLICPFRKEQCEHCRTEIALAKILDHILICPKFKVVCPLDCTLEIQRESLETHIKQDCINCVSECPYVKLGCETKVLKKELNHHCREKEVNHHSFVVDCIDNLNKTVYNLMNKFSEMQAKIPLQRTVPFATKTVEIVRQASVPLQNLERLEKSENLLNKKKRRDSISSNEDEEFIVKKKVYAAPSEQISTLNDNHHPTDNHKTTRIGNKVFEDITIDLMDISKGINVNYNMVKLAVSTKNEHRFALANNVLNNTNCEWVVKIKRLSGWMGIGVCLKELVISNKFKLTATRQNFIHGTFLISSNNYIWNSNNYEENDKMLPDCPKLKTGDEIHFKYEYKKETLEFTITNPHYPEQSYTKTLTEISHPKGNYLVPCVVFLSLNDEVVFNRMIRF